MMSNFTLMGKFFTLNLVHKISILQLCELLLLLLTTVQKREARKSLKKEKLNQQSWREKSKKKFEEKLNQQSWVSSITNAVLNFSSFFFIPLTFFLLTSRLCKHSMMKPWQASLNKAPSKGGKEEERERGLKSEQEAQKPKVSQCQVFLFSMSSCRFTKCLVHPFFG
jgi:hypothetical protein